MDEIWLYHYDPETKQQPMEWWHSSHPAPKNSECKIPQEEFLPRFFGMMTASLLIDLTSKGPNYQRRVLLISAGAIEGHFEGKMLREGHQGGLVLARQCPSSRGICNAEEAGLSDLPVS